MMISSLLHLYGVTGEQIYREISDKSLSFLEQHMIGKDGVYYYYDYEKKRPFLTGQSISNSWVLLAFVEGYEKLGDEKYLTTAEAIAGYALSYLYDWNAGGFFERNSRDADFYAPNERLDLAKPYAENAVFSYSLLRLYQITGDLKYLEAGMKSLARLISNFKPQDETYYLIKAARLATEHSLIEAYNQNIEKINDLIHAKQDDFFLNEWLEGKNIDEINDNVPKLRDDLFNVGLWILALLAFCTGLLSFLSPCTLPILPAYFAHTVGAGKGEILKNTLSFFIGLGLVFSVFGMGATMLGSLLSEHRVFLTRGAGVLIILFGLLQILGKGFSGFQINIKENRRTALGSFLVGGAFALGWSACIGPILSSILLMSATTETLFRGSILLFIYALGLAAPLVFLSLCFDRIKNRRFWTFLKGRMLNVSIFGKTIQCHTASLVSGSLLILIGFFIFNDYLFALNQYSLQTGYVQELLIGGEESLKKLLLR
jgi:cytochrome c-type biogenesis protein